MHVRVFGQTSYDPRARRDADVRTTLSLAIVLLGAWLKRGSGVPTVSGRAGIPEATLGEG